MYAGERRQTPDAGGVGGGSNSTAAGIQSNPHHSPVQGPPQTYSPTARQRSTSYTGHPQSPQLLRSVPPSPSAVRPSPASPPTRERSAYSYYDPMSEARMGGKEHVVNLSPYPPRSPLQRPSPGHELPPPPPPPVSMYANGHTEHRLQPAPPMPTAHSPPPPHGHPAPPIDVRSPPNRDHLRSNGNHGPSTSQDAAIVASATPVPPRSNNPMSMMNLLSDSGTSAAVAPAVASKAPTSPNAAAPASVMAPPPPSSQDQVQNAQLSHTPSRISNEPRKPAKQKHETSKHKVEQTKQKHDHGKHKHKQAKLDHAKTRHEDGEASRSSSSMAPPKTTPVNSSLPTPGPNGPPSLTIRDTEAAFAEIESRDLSDVEADISGMDLAKQAYTSRSNKRTLEVEVTESMKRKKRRADLIGRYFQLFFYAEKAEVQGFIEANEDEVAEEVRMKEIEEDKERKKDQQRKRRREKAIADEQVKREEALQRLDEDDVPDEERSRLIKDIQRFDKKIRDTQSRLKGITPSKENRHESPQNAAALGRREREVAMENGNLMTSFYSSGAAGEDGTPEFPIAARGGRRGGRSGAGGRARKSKEQKQAEKDSAARAQAFLDQGQDLPLIAPKEEERLAGYAKGRGLDHDDSDMSDAPAASFDALPAAGLTGLARFESKGYLQIYEQISRDIARGVPKVTRVKNSSLDTKQSNARKTAQLASKEARRWQLRTNKSTKDVAARAKRAMREMLGFWKRNERDEREGRKAAEKQELDKARRAEAEREANRQKRKLNFLISQTELYSHFIGKKVKTDEIERHGNDGGVVPSGQTITQDPNATHTIDLPDSNANLAAKVRKFDELDFDAEDETALQEAAMANAQNAIKEAQDRARAFNKTEGGDDEEAADLAGAQADFDDGEMNFQNPTSLQSMDIAQPKMLTCQLKEYQVKGLNWLVNLYEQGINGILADEMGLGKTVQSISVLGYLAEVHNIWGPFLVIAPASTLHNWQQEIARFVPDIKVLPYWGSAKDRKILRKFWDRKHITYSRESPFHVLVTSYQLVVQDTAYFQKVKWQYMVLDEAQAIKSSQSSRWKSLLGFHCRNRLLLTGTPIQNNMQELWALLHFIMPSLFDSHDEFSEWFSKDIENHAQSNSKLNEDQLRRLHMILKPFMLRRIKKHVQKELGDKIEEDVFCDLTYRQRAYYTNLRNKISIMDLIEKAAVGDDQDTATLMNLVMQFRKVCNHPDLFERAEIWSPLALTSFAETASFMREGSSINVAYSVRNLIEFWLPGLLFDGGGRLDVAGPGNEKTGWWQKTILTDLSIWDERHIRRSTAGSEAFSWLRFVDRSATDAAVTARRSLMERVEQLARDRDGDRLAKFKVAYDDDADEEAFVPTHAMLNIVARNDTTALAGATRDGHLHRLMNVTRTAMEEKGYDVIERCYLPAASAPPIELVCRSSHALVEKETTFFNLPTRRALYPITTETEAALLRSRLPLSKFPITNLLPLPASQKQRYTEIQVPSMRRFVTDSGKLARLDQLLRQLKDGGHRVLLYFQMTRMIDLMEEYLTYRNYKYCRLDGSTKLEDRRDTVAAFQSSPDIFVFLLSTRAGGLGINLTAADTVIFYDSDWNPTIDSQAMDRAHRLGQTRQVTVYRLITRSTIEERIRKRALQKEEVQRVVISGGHAAGGPDSGGVDFNNRSYGNRADNRTKEMAMWLADDDQAAAIERREAEVMEEEAKAAAAAAGAFGGAGGTKRKRKAPAPKRKEVSMDDMYHEGEGKFEDASHEASGAATPLSSSMMDAAGSPAAKKRKGGLGNHKKAKSVKQRLAVIDGEVG